MDDEKQHPKRPPRIQLFPKVRPFYFVTFNTSKRQRILANDAIHRAFIAFAKTAHKEYQVSVGQYVIMPDHIHFFVSIPEDGIQLQAWIKSLKSILGKALFESGIDKPHWQEGFFDHVLRSGDSYSEKWNYVYLNPVRAGLVDKPADWRFSGEINRLSF